MHVEVLGSGPRIVLVHGSVTPGWMTWNPQRALAREFTLVVPIRTGYPPNPPLDRIDSRSRRPSCAGCCDPATSSSGTPTVA
jgi:hypothetical protein